MTRLRALAVAAALVAAGGCSAPSAGPVDAKSMTPEQIVKAAVEILDHARSAEVESVSTSGGVPVTARFDVFSNGSVSGVATVSEDGSSLQLHLVQAGGQSYAEAPARFWRISLPSARAAEVATLGSHWVIVTGPALGVGGTSLGAMASLLASMEADPGLTSTGTGTVLGKSAVAVRASFGLVLWVAATGTPYPLEITASGPPSITSTFLAWDVGTPPAPPAGAVQLPAR
jgi:hypothetical protein